MRRPKLIWKKVLYHYDSSCYHTFPIAMANLVESLYVVVRLSVSFNLKSYLVGKHSKTIEKVKNLLRIPFLKRCRQFITKMGSNTGKTLDQVQWSFKDYVKKKIWRIFHKVSHCRRFKANRNSPKNDKGL